jgi:hypothetical protein
MRRFVYYNAASAGASLLLDLYPAPVAYSLLKLRSDYTGACIRVRRASDNAEQDIGFLNNAIDEAAIVAFKTFSTENIAVVKWYNQGYLSSACDASQSSLLLQPLIAVTTTPSGIVKDQENNFAIAFTSQLLVFGDGGVYRNKTFGAGFTVYQNNIINARRDIWNWSQPSSATVRFFVSDGVSTVNRHSVLSSRVDGGTIATLTDSANYPTGVKQRTDIVDWENADAFIRRNNNQVAASTSFGTAGSTSDTDSRVVIASSNTSGIGQPFVTPSVAFISEVIFYNDTLTLSEIQAIEQNQLSRYATT